MTPSELSNETLDELLASLGEDTFAGFPRTATLKVPLLRALITELQSYRSEGPSRAETIASPPKPSEAMVEAAALREALEAARTWHEAEDKALSKQPPSHGPNGNQWARLQHQEQIAEITAALSGGAK